ncbi:MAG: AI-2E family transporter [Betaproteobacteria bacterium]
MLGFDRRAAQFAWTVSLVALALYAIYAVRKTLFIFVLAVFFSYMVYPLVRYLHRFTPRRVSHTVSTIVVFMLIVGCIIGLGFLVGPSIVEQAAHLTEQLPALARDTHITDRLPLPHWLEPYRARVLDLVRSQVESGTSYALPMARQFGQGVVLVASNALYIVLIPILAFLLIKDGAGLRDQFLRWIPSERYTTVSAAIVDDLDALLGRYIRALLILALATIVVYSTFFSLVGVPYGLLLASIAGALEFIPVIGPLAAAIICIVVAGLSGYDHLLWLVGFIVLYRVFQDYVLNPYLMSDGVEISPLIVLFGLLAGEELAGVAGIFLSVPVLAAAKIVIFRITQVGAAQLPRYTRKPLLFGWQRKRASVMAPHAAPPVEPLPDG